MMSLSLATGALAVVAGFVVIFFTSLRAVDNEGLTLKVASIVSAVTLLFQILVVVGFYLAYNGGCGSSLGDEGFSLFWPSNFAVAALVTQVSFLIANTVYTLKACCAVDEGEPEPVNDFERTIFFRFWWDHLKDPRTLAHEAREEDEDDNAGSDSDDDLEEEDELAAKEAAGETDKENADAGEAEKSAA